MKNIIRELYFSETGNLIDLSTDGPLSTVPCQDPEHNYVNDTVIAATRDGRENRREQAAFFDAFDMREYIVIPI